MESAEVVQLVRPRAGHFDLGTGYHGDLWLDLDALFLRPARLRPYVDWLAERLRGHGVDADGVPVTPDGPVTRGDGRSAPPAGR
jgi:orotate phosphoribosyltransferase